MECNTELWLGAGYMYSLANVWQLHPLHVYMVNVYTCTFHWPLMHKLPCMPYVYISACIYTVDNTLTCSVPEGRRVSEWCPESAPRPRPRGRTSPWTWTAEDSPCEPPGPTPDTYEGRGRGLMGTMYSNELATYGLHTYIVHVYEH